MMAKKAKCKKCGKYFMIGETGMFYGCDSCNHVQRDTNGYAWEPGEDYMDLESVSTGKIDRVYRRDALVDKA